MIPHSEIPQEIKSILLKTLDAFYFLVILFILLTTSSFAQGIKLGIGGGISAISNSNSGLSNNSGYHLSAKAKLDIPLFPIKPVVFIQYYVLDGNYGFTTPLISYSGSTTQKIFSFGFGGEFELIPGPISPYLALDFGYNNIGEIHYDPAILDQFSYPAVSRTGIDIGVGTEIKIPLLFSLDISAKYNMLNLFGKPAGEGSINAVNLNLSVIF